jgi:outer membrane lipoprotein-sorting protein
VSRTKWGGFQQADPITYVGTRTFYDERGVTRKELIITDVEINPGTPDSLFSPPNG